MTFSPRMSKEALFRSQFCLVIRQDLDILAALLDAGANVGQTNQRGSTLLHLAARRGDCEVIQLALHFGAKVNALGERGWTPLHEAVSNHQITAARLLLSAGADPKIANAGGEDAKKLAVKCGIAEADLPEYFGTICSVSSSSSPSFLPLTLVCISLHLQTFSNSRTEMPGS